MNSVCVGVGSIGGSVCIGVGSIAGGSVCIGVGLTVGCACTKGGIGVWLGVLNNGIVIIATIITNARAIPDIKNIFFRLEFFLLFMFPFFICEVGLPHDVQNKSSDAICFPQLLQYINLLFSIIYYYLGGGFEIEPILPL